MPSQAPSTHDDIVDSAYVSEWIKVPPGTLRNWRSRGIGPASFRIGGRVVYRRRAVEAWLATQELSTKRGGVE